MNYYLNFNDFEEYKYRFSQKVNEFNDEVYNIFKLCHDVEWVGLGHDKTIEATYNQIEEFNKVSDNLNKFLEFMDIVTNDYTEGVEEIRNKFKEIQDIIDEGKLKRGDVFDES